jgi:hypothetical protein
MGYLSQALSFSTFMACIFFLMASMLLLWLLSGNQHLIGLGSILSRITGRF